MTNTPKRYTPRDNPYDSVSGFCKHAYEIGYNKAIEDRRAGRPYGPKDLGFLARGTRKATFHGYEAGWMLSDNILKEEAST